VCCRLLRFDDEGEEEEAGEEESGAHAWTALNKYFFLSNLFQKLDLNPHVFNLQFNLYIF